MRISKEARQKFRAALGTEYFSTKEEDLILFGSDGTNTPGLRPDAVARPGNTSEVAKVMGLARAYNIPIIPRGAGSGLTGGALPLVGGIIVVMTRFNKLIKIDAENLLAVVEPGMVTSDFQAEVEKQGLFYPPDPASREFSTLGGNAAENAGGTRAVKYGVTRDYVLGLEAVLGTGEVIETGVRTAKGVVGYDLTRLLVGSEGTLGIITRLTLRLIPQPETRETLIAFFDDLKDAARTVTAMTSAKVVPATLEFMDRASINCVEDYLNIGLDRTTGGLLLIETDGSSAQARVEADLTAELCKECGARLVKRAENQIEAQELWQARRAISPALFRVASGKINEDIVVPRNRIPDMIEIMEAISRESGLQIINFGHAGDGNIHVNVMYDRQDDQQKKRAEKTVREILSQTINLGGTISGEHGVGTTKKAFIEMEISPEALDLMKRIKTAFDPQGLLNPGKIFPS